jgi:HEAT repeat protein
VQINPGATAPPEAPAQQITPAAPVAEVEPASAPEPVADTASFADLSEEASDAGDMVADLWPGHESEHAEEDPDADLPAPKPQTTGIDPLRALHHHLEEAGNESADGAMVPEATGDGGAELVKGLRALDECREDPAYEENLQRVTREAAVLADEGPSDDTYRAVLVLSSHAAEALRSERQRALAEEALFGLAAGPRLDDVVQRACDTAPQASVRATQILLQLGAHAVPRIFDALVNEPDPEHRGQLNALLIAMGEKSLPEVKASLEAAHPERARLAARLSGEMQNPACIPYLAALVKDVATPIELVREAAKALVRIGTPSAVAVLQEAVASPRPDLAGAAAYCLGASQAPRALETLAGTLRRALREDQDELARETLRGLGALGRSEAVPVLEEVLSKGGLLARRRLRDLKLGAVSALARIRGDEARAALERASAKGDSQVRHAASAALKRSGSR